MQCFKAAVVLCFVITATSIPSAKAEVPAAEPSLYAAAYLPPKPVVVVGGPLHYNSPYDGSVASTSTNVFRTSGPGGQVSAVQKTAVETPYSSAHKVDVRYTNDAQLPYYHNQGAAVPYGHGPVTVVPYGYGPTAAPYGHGPVAVPYGHGPVAVPYGHESVAVPYGHGPISVPYGHGSVAVPYGHGPISVPYGHGPVAVPYGQAAAVPYAQHHSPTAGGIVTPHSVSHASFSGPHGTHYSYRR